MMNWKGRGRKPSQPV